jgi:hypothetical protein
MSYIVILMSFQTIYSINYAYTYCSYIVRTFGFERWASL